MRVQSNLIGNFSFESAQPGGVPLGWQWDKRNTDAACVLDTEVAHGGKQSLKLTNGTSFGAHIYGMLWRATPIRVEPGKTYTLSAWVKSESPGQVGLIGGGAWQIRVQAPVTGKDWQRIATTFTVGEGDRDFIVRISTESPTPGVWVDDLKLEEGAEATPVQPAGDSAGAFELEPAKPVVEVQGDGSFKLAFTAWMPRAAACLAEARLGDGEAARQALTLEPGAWRIQVKGEATAANDQPRMATLRLSESGRELAKSAMRARFYSPANALARIDTLKQRLPLLGAELEGVKKLGQDTAYPMVSYTVLENFIPYAQTDVQRNEIKRALAQLGDLEQMADRLSRDLKEAQAGRRAFAPVPRWTGERRPVIQGSAFMADSRFPGQEPSQRPVFFTGYGHFAQVITDMEKWPAYGANIIQLEFGPHSVFAKEGATNPAPMQSMLRTLDRAQKQGMAVCLLISPHYFPAWALDKWPHLRKRREGFLGSCLHAPEGRELLRNFVAVALAPLKDHPALNSICLSNEPVNKEEPCEAGTKEWQAWLEQRHGNIAKLNTVSGSNFTSFARVSLPNPFGPRPAPSLWMDYIRFNQEFFAGWHKMLADAVHEVAPGLPVHAKAMTWTMLNDTDIAYGVDATLFGRLSNINGNDAVNFYSFGEGDFAQGWQANAMGHDLQRSTLDAPVFNSENHIIVDRETRCVPAEHVRTALWQAALHGQSATTIWVWERSFDPKSDFAGSIMHRPACAEAVGIVNHDLNRAALEMTALQQAPPRVLLLQSVTASVQDFGRYSDCLGKLYTALAFTGLKIGFVTERQLESGLTPPESILFIPNIAHLSDAAFAALQKWRGRVVLVGDGELLTHNEYGQTRSARLTGDRIPYRYGPTQWRELWQALLKQLPAWNEQPAITLRTHDGQSVWGVEWRTAETAQGMVINLCNYRHEPVTVRLIRRNTQVSAIDVLSGQKLGQQITLKSLQPVLARVAE